MADNCPEHPDGYVCERTDKHTLHRCKTEWSFVTWGEPDPVRKPRKKGKKGHTNIEMLEVIHRAMGTDPKKLSRRDDPDTSKEAAKSLRTGSQKHALLVQYALAPDGLTDDEAADRAGLLAKPGCCWWHRSSDLRDDGYIEDIGVRVSPLTGEDRMVCRITDRGREAL